MHYPKLLVRGVDIKADVVDLKGDKLPVLWKLDGLYGMVAITPTEKTIEFTGRIRSTKGGETEAAIEIH